MEIFKKEEKELDLKDKIELFKNYSHNNEIFNFILNNFNKNITTNKINVKNYIFDDLNIFPNSNSNSIFNKINFTKTKLGKFLLENILKNPTSNLQTLSQKFNIIKNITSNLSISNQIHSLIDNIKNHEDNCLWFWKNIDEYSDAIHKMIFFQNNYLHFLNKNELLLNIWNLYKIFIGPFLATFYPFLQVIITYFVFRFFKINVSFWTLAKTLLKQMWNMGDMLLPKNKIGLILGWSAKIWTIFYFLQQIYFQWFNAYQTYQIINLLHEKLISIYSIYRIMRDVYQKVRDLKIDFYNESNLQNSFEFFDNHFECETFKCSPGIFTNKGKIISRYFIFLKEKEKFQPILEFLGYIDYLFGIDTLIKKYNEKNKPISIANFDFNSNTANIFMKNIWHPFLDNKENLVMNNVELNDKVKNMIITGPNAGGKSTYIKTLAINILLAQTIGICFAEESNLTPFFYINTYLHIPDNQGKESLFEAEMHRCLEQINMIKELKERQFSFNIMDEIFSSTNYVEGYSAAYAVSKKLSKYENSITIITTHYTNLNKVEKETNGRILNYHFTIDRDKNNKIIYPYKLLRGVSKDYIALELLKENGFDEDLLEEANNVLKTIKDEYSEKDLKKNKNKNKKKKS
jgi:DNA mismatch repair protein MutS